MLRKKFDLRRNAKKIFLAIFEKNSSVLKQKISTLKEKDSKRGF